jgi:hypothetical protein
VRTDDELAAEHSGVIAVNCLILSAVEVDRGDHKR